MIRPLAITHREPKHQKELVSKIAADIKNLKPVEPYKAKGITEKGQFILRKEGKKK